MLFRGLGAHRLSASGYVLVCKKPEPNLTRRGALLEFRRLEKGIDGLGWPRKAGRYESRNPFLSPVLLPASLGASICMARWWRIVSFANACRHSATETPAARDLCLSGSETLFAVRSNHAREEC